jgi:hypothetical protein
MYASKSISELKEMNKSEILDYAIKNGVYATSSMSKQEILIQIAVTPKSSFTVYAEPP